MDNKIESNRIFTLLLIYQLIKISIGLIIVVNKTKNKEIPSIPNNISVFKK
jgi:hypothetical protein